MARHSALLCCHWVSSIVYQSLTPLTVFAILPRVPIAVVRLVLYTFIQFDPRRFQSQRPSFQPVRHRSSHLLQSNSFLPSFRLTSLCASHSQFPNSLRPSTRICSFCMYDWKSSAHTQQGYSLENSLMKPRRSSFWLGEGFSGYVAAIECSSCQVPRPRASTSGGQSSTGVEATGVGFLTEPFI